MRTIYCDKITNKQMIIASEWPLKPISKAKGCHNRIWEPFSQADCPAVFLFYISYFVFVMKHWQIQRSRLAKQVDISQADRPPRRAPFWWRWISSSPLHNSLCPHLLLLYCCLSLVSFLINIKGMDLTSYIWVFVHIYSYSSSPSLFLTFFLFSGGLSSQPPGSFLLGLSGHKNRYQGLL